MYKKLIQLAILASTFICSGANAGLITISDDVQGTWWSNGVAQSQNDELRLNRIDLYDQRIGVQFNDLSLLDGVEVLSAELQMYRYYGYNNGESAIINAYSIEDNWSENSNQPSAYYDAIDSLNFDSTRANNGWFSWNITDLLTAWLQEEVVNNGVMLWGTGDASFQKFYSSRYDGYSPKLVITTKDIPEPISIHLILLLGLLSLFYSRIKKIG